MHKISRFIWFFVNEEVLYVVETVDKFIKLNFHLDRCWIQKFKLQVEVSGLESKHETVHLSLPYHF